MTKHLPNFKEVAKDIAVIGIPSIVGMLSALFVEVINTAFVGHLGDEAMVAGVGMGNMYMNILCLSVIFGLNSTLNTLVSQSYGMKNYRMCGVYMNRARIVNTMIFFPILILLIKAYEVFQLMGFEPNASRFAQDYINLLAPGIYFLGLFDANRRLLNNTGYQYGPMIIQIVTCLLHILWCHLFIQKFDLNIKGTAIATTITHLTNLVSTNIYTFYLAKLKQVTLIPTRDAFIGLWDFLKLGIPSIGMMCFEWWSFEIMTVMAAYISVQATAAQIIVLNTGCIIFMPPLGLANAASALIGREIGKFNVPSAKRFRNVIMYYGYIQSVVIGLALYLFRKQIASFYTDIEELQIEVVKGLEILALVSFFDHLQSVLNGIIRGLGKFWLPNLVIAVSYYLIAVPLDYVFAFPCELGIRGLWLGQLCGLAVLCLCLSYLISCQYDWNEVAKEAKIRNELAHNKIIEKGYLDKEGLVTHDNEYYYGSNGAASSTGGAGAIQLT